MAQEFSRSRRVGEQIQQVLALLIQQEIKDPRIGMVTVTAVKLTKEFEHARVFVTVLGDQQQQELSLQGLNNAAGFLRSELAHRLKLRSTPKLHFEYDKSTEEGNRMSSLINSAIALEKQNND